MGSRLGSEGEIASGLTPRSNTVRGLIGACVVTVIFILSFSRSPLALFFDLFPPFATSVNPHSSESWKTKYRRLSCDFCWNIWLYQSDNGTDILPIKEHFT